MPDKSALQIGPVALDERIDPTDPNELGELSRPNAGAAYDSLRLIQENSAIFAKLGPVLAIPPDINASNTLDIDELEEKVGQEVESASVRGRNPKTAKVVIYLVRPGGPMGRSVKGTIPYDELPKSKKAYEKFLATLDENPSASASQDRRDGGDPRTHALESEVARLREELAERDRAEQAHQDAVAGRTKPDEPGEGKPEAKSSARKPAAAKKPAGAKKPAARRKPAAKS